MKHIYISIGLSIITALPVAASSWNPTFLVNTEAFQVIDEGDSTADIVLQFGDILNHSIAYDRANGRFNFSDDISVQGGIVAAGTITGTTLVATGIPNCDLLYTTTSGQVSCGSSPTLTGANLATIQVRRDSNFIMPLLNTFYDVPFNITDTESNTDVLEHDIITNTERIVAKETGFYLISYHVNANDPVVTHQLDVRVQKNSASTISGSLTIGRNYQDEYSPNVSTNVIFLNSNDYLTLQVSRSTVNTVINETVFTATKLNGIRGEKGDPGELTATGANALFVNQGGDTMTGSLTLANNSNVIVSGNITLNSDNEAADAVLTFGNSVLAETLKFSATSNWFEFSDDVRINGTLFGSGSAVFDNNLTIDNGTLFVNGTSNQVGINTLVPHSTLTASGSFATTIRTVTATGTLITATDHMILADATAAAFTVILPTAVGIQGRQYVIKKVDTSLANVVTVLTTSGQTIDGLTHYTLKVQSEELALQSDNANWRIVQSDQLDVSAYRTEGVTLNRWYSSSNSVYNFPGTTFLTAASTLRVTPFIISKLTTIDQMAINITTASPGNNCRVGIYNDDGNSYPSTLVVDAGSQASNLVGVKTFTTNLPVTLQPALYWLAHNCSGAPTIRGINSIGIPNVLGFDPTLALNPGIGWSIASAFGALPTTYPAGAAVLQAAGGTGGNPGVFVRVSQ